MLLKMEINKRDTNNQRIKVLKKKQQLYFIYGANICGLCKYLWFVMLTRK